MVAVPPGVAFGAGVLGPALGVQQIAALQLQVWQGQFPPPDAVEAYNRASPQAFDRMITMAEKLQDAQIELNSKGADAARADTRRGHYLGSTVTLSALAGAVACAWLNQPWVAAILCGVPVLSVANILVANARGVAALKALRPQPAPAPPHENEENKPAG